jgi:ferredoxin
LTRRKLRLRVNPVACDAFGYCVELLPEMISADEWGYPVLADAPVPPRLLDLAERAVRDCPRRALFMEDCPEAPDPRGSRRRDNTAKSVMARSRSV